MPAWTIPYSESGVFFTHAGMPPMLAFTKSLYYIISDTRSSHKPCIQLLRFNQPVSYLPVNASMDNTILKSGVFPMPAFTKSTSCQTLKTFQTMYITKQIP